VFLVVNPSFYLIAALPRWAFVVTPWPTLPRQTSKK